MRYRLPLSHHEHQHEHEHQSNLCNQGSMRSASCRCDDCVAAMSMFSAKDLMAVSSSKVDFGDDTNAEASETAAAAPTTTTTTTASPPSSVAEKPVPAKATNAPAPKETSSAPPAETPKPAAAPAPTPAEPPTAPAAAPQAVQVVDAPEEDFSNAPLDELINHSNWKARKVGFEKLTEPANKGELSQAYFEKCLVESSMGALDPGLDAASAYVKHAYAGKDEGALIATSVPKLFKKALVGRPGTKKRAMDLCLDFMEVDKASMEACLQALLLGLKEKNPKVGAACLDCMRAAVSTFGGRRLPIQVVQQAIIQGSDVKNPAIRTMATGLATDMDMWYMGAFKDLVMAVIDNPATQKAICKSLEDAAAKRDSAEPLPAPIRTFRGEDAAKASAKAGAGQSAADNGAGDAGAAPDLFDVLPEKEILDKVEEMKFETRLKEPKWKDRRQAILDVIELCGPTPRLARGEYSDMVRALRGVIQSDSNQAVVVDAIKLLATLGSGLRGEFHIHARACCDQLLHKYRDKKAACISAVDTTLDVFATHCFNLTDDRVVHTIDENISQDGSSGKQKSTPLQRKNILAWIGRALQSGSCWNESRGQLGTVDEAGFTSLVNHMVACCGDADPDVREVAAHGLGALSHGGEAVSRPMPASCKALVESEVDKLVAANPKLQKKLQGPSAPGAKPKSAAAAAAAAAAPAASSSAAPSAKPAKPASAAPTAAKEKPADAAPAKPLRARKPPAASGAPTRRTTASSAAASKSSSAGAATVSAQDDGDMGDAGEPVMAAEEAQEQVAGFGIEGFGEALSAFDEAAKWQDKMALFSCLVAFVDAQEKVSQAQAHAIIAFVGAKTKGFKESNFNIMNEAWAALEKTIAACESPAVSRSYAAAILDPATKKIGDRKQDGPVKSLALALCEATGPKYISFKIIKAAEKITSPKVIEESLALLRSIAEEFGARSLSVQNVVSFASGAKGLGARQAPCKTKATELLAELYRQLGEPIRQLLGDQAEGAVGEAFDKIGFQGPSAAAPKRKVKGAEDAPEGAASASADLGDLIPRADISAMLTDKLLKDLSDESTKTAWKLRLKAMDDVLEIIKSAKNRIQLTRSVRQLTAELRKRLADTNRNLAAKAATALASVGNAVGGDGAAVLAKGTAGALFSYLSDGKKTVVTAIKDALEKWTVHDGQVHPGAFLAMAQQAPLALKDPKNDRTVLLGWFLENSKADGVLTGGNDVAETLHALAEPFLSCLQSRDPKVRKLAGQAITVSVRYFGKDEGETIFNEGCRDLKPAVVRSITPLLKAAYEEAGNAIPPAGDAKPAAVDQPATESRASAATASAAAPSAATAVDSGATAATRAPASPPGAPSAPAAANAPAASGRTASAASRRGVSRTLPRSGIPGPKKRGGTLPRPIRRADPAAAVEQAAPADPAADYDADASSEAPFKPPNRILRHKREERGRRFRWPAIFDEKDKHRMNELRQGLRDDLEKVLSKDLVDKMFVSADKGRAARGSALDPAFNTLLEELPNHGPAARECFDLLLKWSTLQLHNNNSTVTLHVLELLDNMFELASGAEYVLSDYEAAAFLPHLLHKLGEKQKRFRDAVRRIMELLCNCYPVSKYAPYVHSEIGPSQRSAYVLTECLSELARLARIHGTMLLKVRVGVGNNVMRTVAGMVDDSRKEVRAAALEFMEAIWEHEGRDDDAFMARVAQFKTALSDKATPLVLNHFKEARSRDPAGDLGRADPSPRELSDAEPLSSGPPESPPRAGQGVAPARKLRLQRPGAGASSPPRQEGAPATSATAAPASSVLSIAPPSNSISQSMPAPRTPDTKSAKKSAELKFQFDLPQTPPSPQNVKRLSMPNTPAFATPHMEKENDPSLESFSRRRSMGMGMGMGTPGVAKGARVMAMMAERISMIPRQSSAYLDLICDPSSAKGGEPEARNIREAGIKALSLVGSGDPPADWVESGCGGQKEWIDLLKDDLDVPAVVGVLLDFVDEVVSRAPPTTPLRDEDGQDVRDVQSENRLLKLVVPAIFTLAWWPELRRLAAGPIGSDPMPSTLGRRWTTCLCNLLARLMERRRLQRQLETAPGGFAVGSETIHEIFMEQDRLLKAVQTTFAKLSESPSWLCAVLHRFRRCNEVARDGLMPEFAGQEVHLKRVLRRAIAEYVELQESYVEMYQSVHMPGAVAALGELVSHGITERDLEADQDRDMVERLVRSLLRVGNEFTQFVEAQGPTRSLHTLVSQILVSQAKQAQGEALTPSREQPSEAFGGANVLPSAPPREPASASALAAGLAAAAQSPGFGNSDAAPLSSEDSQKLQEIFGRFSQAIEGMSPTAKRDAFKELNVFFNEHPGFEDSTYLKELSGPFHKHIREGVRRIREEEKEAARRRQQGTGESARSLQRTSEVSERIRRLRSLTMKASGTLSGQDALASSTGSTSSVNALHSQAGATEPERAAENKADLYSSSFSAAPGPSSSSFAAPRATGVGAIDSSSSAEANPLEKIEQATAQANQVAQSATLLSIRERMAARKQRMEAAAGNAAHSIGR
ncbi:Cytoskeleton-associated protein 5 [Hondaea fermentalgiana]|uniref:Cytoskeleton-associated protein 5 n=1 Tax=Hondaea fermentalgiana TaxID=2315210 RepID=A0A2R5GMN3_9STRA|nr:Cytoskeleton-associated protein 5 [Hondaea fermentalgiana]|eukprot:GBG32147.1 Cytoskeleton-associated protein 5 [Hondaea fermentalgiana]